MQSGIIQSFTSIINMPIKILYYCYRNKFISKMSQYKSYPADFGAAVSKFLLKIAALWVPNKTDPIWVKLFFLFYNTALIGFTNFVYLLYESVHLKYTVHGVTTLVKHLGMLLTHVAGNIKVGVVYFQRNKLKKINDILNSDNYKYEDYEDYRPGEIFAKEMRFSRKVNTVFALLCTGVGVLNFFGSLPKMNSFHEGDNCIADYLPFFSSFPFSTETKKMCGWALLFESVPLTVYAFQIAAHDGIFVTQMNCIKTHMIIVMGALRTLRKRCIKRLQIPEHITIRNDKDYPKLENEVFQELKKCTIHLQMILHINQETENIFSYVTLFQTLASMLIKASNIYRMASVPGIFELGALMQYIAATTMQFAMYCWFGNEIVEASHEMNTAFYESDWIYASNRCKKIMLINMSQMQRPLFQTLGKFSRLTLSTFLNTWKGAFSYYTVFAKRTAQN